MLNFKRCATAVALTMSAVPALAQDMPMPETVVINVEGTNTFYRVPFEVAAGLCEVTEETLALIVENADVIYCTIGAEMVEANDFSEFETFEDDDFGQPDLDLDDDGIVDLDDDDLDGDGILNADDDDLDGDDILDADDDDVFDIDLIDADADTDADTDDTDTDTDTDTDGEVEGEVEGEAEGEVEGEVEGETETSTGG